MVLAQGVSWEYSKTIQLGLLSSQALSGAGDSAFKLTHVAACGLEALVPRHENLHHGLLHRTARKMRSCFPQRQWSKKKRIQDGSPSLLYLNLRSDIYFCCILLATQTNHETVLGGYYTKVWIPQDRNHQGPPLGTGYNRYRGQKGLEVTTSWWPVTSNWLGMKCQSPALLLQGKSISLVYFVLQRSPWDQDEAETSPEILPFIDFCPFPPVPLLLPYQLPVAPGSTSLINHLHSDAYLKVCFWEIQPRVMWGMYVCTCTCARVHISCCKLWSKALN